MKTLLKVLVFVLAADCLQAQSVSVEPSIERLGKGYNAAFRIGIPYADPVFVEKQWRIFLKEHNGKVKGTKGEVSGDDVVISALGSDPMRFLSDVGGADSGTLVRVAVERNQVFVSKATHPETAGQLEGLFRRWSLDVALSSMNQRISSAKELIEKQTREFESLSRSTRRLEQSNESLRKQITVNEKLMEDNSQKLSGLTTSIDEQNKLLLELEKKKSALK